MYDMSLGILDGERQLGEPQIEQVVCVCIFRAILRDSEPPPCPPRVEEIQPVLNDSESERPSAQR